MCLCVLLAGCEGGGSEGVVVCLGDVAEGFVAREKGRECFDFCL